jgi:hypothetical protein
VGDIHFITMALEEITWGENTEPMGSRNDSTKSQYLGRGRRIIFRVDLKEMEKERVEGNLENIMSPRL